MARKKAKARPRKAAAQRRSRKAPAKLIKSAAEKTMRPAVDASQTSSGPASADAAALVLPEALDSSSVSGIKELLLARRGESIVVDAGQVRRTGMQAVQVLISAAKTWQADGKSYVLSNPTQEFLDTLALVGLSREQLLVEGCLG